MRTIIHISDMHFGKIDSTSTDSLVTAFSDINPDLVIVSGDLTQRAEPEQFKSAKKFLDDLIKAKLNYFVIPGNHDIEPMWKPPSRIFDPYKSYKKYISETIEPTYSDGEIAIASLNTVRPTRLKNGSVSKIHIKKVQDWFSKFSPKVTKILVTHHPLDLPLSVPERKLAKRSVWGVELLSESNVDIYLSGHYHRSSVTTTAGRYNKLGYHAIALQAGTLSLRQRGEVQSFNVISLDKPSLSIETYFWDSINKTFSKKQISNFLLTDNSWNKL